MCFLLNNVGDFLLLLFYRTIKKETKNISYVMYYMDVNNISFLFAFFKEILFWGQIFDKIKHFEDP